MTESIYKEYENKYYNPTDNDKKPGDNDNWKSIQKGFHDISTTQLETSAGLTLGKGTEDETSVTAAELSEMKSGKAVDSLAISAILSKDINVTKNTSFNVTMNGLKDKLDGKLTPNSKYYFHAELYGNYLTEIYFKPYLPGDAGYKYMTVDENGVIYFGDKAWELNNVVALGLYGYCNDSTTIDAGTLLVLYLVRGE